MFFSFGLYFLFISTQHFTFSFAEKEKALDEIQKKFYIKY